MSRLIATIGLAAAGCMLLGTLEASLAGPSGRDTTFQMRNHKTFSIRRYPGDQAFAGGTVRMQGPNKGPYVERCHWTAESGVFGAPFGLTQRCHRYTLENTPE
ncbi:MAG: hypothetical protein ACOC71_04770 [Hyphomicrobiales bacterium]